MFYLINFNVRVVPKNCCKIHFCFFFRSHSKAQIYVIFFLQKFFSPKTPTIFFPFFSSFRCFFNLRESFRENNEFFTNEE